VPNSPRTSHPSSSQPSALSASIPVLKSRARKLRRAEQIPLHQALDRVAAAEGYSSWSLLAAKTAARESDLFDQLEPGELVLIAARPGQGKTLCAVELLIASLRHRQQGWFFALQNDAPPIDAYFEALGEQRSTFEAFEFEHSDAIDAAYIAQKVGAAVTEKAVVVIDHLQLLDQRRRSPPLHQQMAELRDLARRTRSVIVAISQIRSAFDAEAARFPSVADVRLLDELDLGLFDRMVFMHEGKHRSQRSAG